MVRTIVIPENEQIKLDIPQEYIGKEIEVTFLALDELIPKGKIGKMGDFWGVISDDTAKKLHNQVETTRKEWERDI